MTKLNFNNSVFVVKVYETTNPSIVESFPAVVVPATLVKLF